MMFLKSFLTGSAIFIFLIEICEAIHKRMKWFTKENSLQVVHLVAVTIYLLLIYLNCREPWSALAGGVVCFAWLDTGYSIRHLMFGRWPSIGLYVSMLMIVSQNIQLDIGY